MVYKDPRAEQRNWSSFILRFFRCHHLLISEIVWLAPSSAWSLTARLIIMMTKKLHIDSDPAIPRFYLDGDLYPCSWNNLPKAEVPDMHALPSMEHVLYLFNIANFHLCPTYRFLDEGIFISQLQEFYGSRGCESARGSRFWIAQFFLVLALGNAFLTRPRTQAGPPGSKYFERAMSIMPSQTSTGKDSLLAMEALALSGIYLYAIDHREAAHVQVCEQH
jgi:hypothetical protein